MLFRKLFLTYLIVAVLALAISGGFAVYLVWQAAGVVELDRAAAVGRELAAALQDQEWSPELLRQEQRVMDTLERGEATHAWLLDRSGNVVAASVGAEPRPGGHLELHRVDGSRRGTPGLMRIQPRTRKPQPVFARPITRSGVQVGSVVLAPSLEVVARARASAVRFTLYGSLVAALLLAVISYVLSQRVARPVERISEAARRLARGDFASRVQWRSDDEVGRLAVAFNDMAADLDRLELARRDLMATVSHELKGPLARIAGYLEAIYDGIGGEEDRTRHLEVVRREVGRLTRLVNDLLDFSRLEAGRLKLHPIPCDLSPNLTRAAEVFEAVAQSGGVTFSIAIPAILPIVESQPERVEQAVANLLENAFAHTPAGGAISVTASQVDRALEVTVADTGPGIPPEELERIWDRFVKLDRARTPVKATGFGLGLTIVKQLIELQGGQVFATSEPGKGSRFGFRFPLAKPES